MHHFRATMHPFETLLRRAAIAVLSAAALVPAIASAQASDYPNKPIRILVPFATGGAADTLARQIGQRLTTRWGQAVVVDNRTGAGGTIGMAAAKQMPADGYNFVLISNSQAVSEAVYPKLSYDTTKDFVPIDVLGDSPIVIAVNPSTGFKTFADLVAYARKNPGKLSYGSCGVGTAHHLAMEIIKFQANLDMVHVGYRGCSPGVIDAVGGQIPMVISSAPTIFPQVHQGKLVALAVTNPQRSVTMPDVPTIAQSGVPELAHSAIGNWYGFLAPKGTPADVIAKFDAAVRAEVVRPEVQASLMAAGVEVGVADGAKLAALYKADLAQFTQAVRTAQIKPE